MSEAVPEGWAISNLDDAIDILSGFPFKSSEFTNDQSDFGLIRIRNLLGQDLETFYSGEYSDDFIVQAGDILIGMDGDFHIVKWKSKNALLNQRICKLVSKQGGFDINFVHYFLIPELQKIHNQTTATTVKHLSIKDIRAVEQAFPPLPEQKKIASILTSVDEVIETTQKQIDKLQDLKKATMNELLTRGIGHTEFKDSELGRIPKSWEVTNLKAIGNFAKGKGISKKETSLKGVPCIRYAEIYTSYNFVIESFKSFISPEIVKTTKKLKINDIIFAGSGETVEDIGKSVTFVFDYDAYVGGDSIIFSPKIECNSVFLSYQLNDDLRRKQLRKLGQGSSVIHVYTSGIEQLKIVLPSISEQNNIAETLQSYANAITTKQHKLSQTQSLKKSLMQDLLTGKVRVQVH
jgi:type I restriction enzyme, S subunit